MTHQSLPTGGSPLPVTSPHFPGRLHAFVWRNWQLVPLERLAQVVRTEPGTLLALGRSMGLAGPPPVSAEVQRRSAITVIRRNWHLLPYDQLLVLLGWNEAQLAYALQEDDFLFIKLGSVKPHCEPLVYTPPDEQANRRASEIAGVVHQEFGHDVGLLRDPLFSFVTDLSRPVEPRPGGRQAASLFSPRICSSYFALYGDPLLDDGEGPYPDGYLARLAASGIDGVWLQAVLYRMAPFPWQPELSADHQRRLEALRGMIDRARRHGIGIYLYLNEPRAMPLSLYDAYPGLKGVTVGEQAALCTSVPEVQRYLQESVASICRAVPGLAGFFTITASENLTNCWSHSRSHSAPMTCPRCSGRSGAEVIAEVNTMIAAGIRDAGSTANLLVWDWGWPDDWAEDIITALPSEATLMSVSEWDLPITRGGVASVVGEYTLSAVGPGPRATRHWQIARRRGLKTAARVQAASTWELSAVPYIPVVQTAAQHVSNVRALGVDGMMVGWTLGGYPSPNLEVVAALGRTETTTPEQALEEVARRRFGPHLWQIVVEAWRSFSSAFTEFPYHIGVVYHAPLQMGPANPLWERPTGYRATMVGLPYDDLDGWRAVYPPDVFAAQMEKAALGFGPGLAALRAALTDTASLQYRAALQAEINVAQVVTIHLQSTATMARFVMARNALDAATSPAVAQAHLATLERLLGQEEANARQLYSIQREDSRIGFEASNQYYYVPLDLAEKMLNCHDLRQRWLPAQRVRWTV